MDPNSKLKTVHTSYVVNRTQEAVDRKQQTVDRIQQIEDCAQWTVNSGRRVGKVDSGQWTEADMGETGDKKQD